MSLNFCPNRAALERRERKRFSNFRWSVRRLSLSDFKWSMRRLSLRFLMECVASLLIPKWLQTPNGYGESPNAKFFVSLPLSIRDSPYAYGECIFGHPFSHALKNIVFAEVSLFSCSHRANIPHHTGRLSPSPHIVVV